MTKRFFCVLTTIILVFTLITVPAYSYTPSTFEVDAEGALLVNLDTGDRLYSKNTDNRLYPASLTKLMTALVLYESTEDPDSEIITISEYAIKSLEGTDSSTGGLKIGEELTVRQMLYVLLLSSANEGANDIAEHVAGSVEDFVLLMNEKAAKLGMSGTHFANAHGLHDHEHYTTVDDMYILAKTVLDIPLLKEVCYSTKYKLEATNKSKARNYTTTNLMLLNNGQKCSAEKYKNQAYYYKYARGLKTGYTDPAGRCLISTATTNGYTYLCILMNSPVYDDVGKKIRIEFGDTKALYEWAFNEFEYRSVLQSGEIISEVPVELSWDTDYVSAAPNTDFSAIIPKAADSTTLSYEVKWYKDTYDAPIKKGDVLGECDILYGGEALGTVSLVATQDVERNALLYMGRGIKNFFSSVFGSVPFLIIVGLLAAAIVIFIIICIIMNSPRRKKRRY